MKWLIATTLLTFAPFVSAGTDTKEIVIEYTNAWYYACEFGEYDCTDVKLPTLVIIKLPDGIRGTVDNKNIYISVYLVRGIDRESTMMHEMVHWLQGEVDGHPMSVSLDDKPGVKRLCEDEGAAFAAVDKWLRFTGRSYRQRGPNWWYDYYNCWEFYDTGE